MLHYLPTKETSYNCLISTNETSLFKYDQHNYWQLNGIDHIEHVTKFHNISIADTPLNQHCLHIYGRSCFTHLKAALLNKITFHRRVCCCGCQKDSFADIKFKVISVMNNIGHSHLTGYTPMGYAQPRSG